MRIIFHHPLPLNKNAKSASGIRPLRMLDAFVSLGCKVDLVTGYSAERKRRTARVKENLRKGMKYDFVYSESSTMPTTLTDPHHLPIHPLMDWLFFRLCKSHNIPVGLFYRDIYWRFHNYGEGLNRFKAVIGKAAYRYDLLMYQDTLTRLYLPSLEMGRYVPTVNPDIFDPLPPGHSSPEVALAEYSHSDQKPLRLFYVGGMSTHYQLHKLFNVVRELAQVELTVCTREAEWRAVQDSYPALTPNIKIIHKAGEEMEAYLKDADVAVLFVKPLEYREFAAPVKLYEYLGFCKPILASDGTLAGQFVRDNSVGWTLPYDESAVLQLLHRLVSDPSPLTDLSAKLKKIADDHSWRARALQVIKDLSQ